MNNGKWKFSYFHVEVLWVVKELMDSDAWMWASGSHPSIRRKTSACTNKMTFYYYFSCQQFSYQQKLLCKNSETCSGIFIKNHFSVYWPIKAFTLKVNSSTCHWGGQGRSESSDSWSESPDNAVEGSEWWFSVRGLRMWEMVLTPKVNLHGQSEDCPHI